MAQHADRSTRAKQWSSWAKTSLEGSAGKAHKFPREPAEWRPSLDMSKEAKSCGETSGRARTEAELVPSCGQSSSKSLC
eukprot:1517898-Heterocapsa_arctica.AAC.1